MDDRSEPADALREYLRMGSEAGGLTWPRLSVHLQGDTVSLNHCWPARPETAGAGARLQLTAGWVSTAPSSSARTSSPP